MESKFIKILNILILINLSLSCDLSYKQLKTCQKYYTENVEEYEDFFNIPDVNSKDTYPDEIAKLKVYVISSASAHIALLVNSDSGSKGIQIVLGGLQNTRSYVHYLTDTSHAIQIHEQIGPINLDSFLPLEVKILATADKRLVIHLNGEKYIDIMLNEALPLKFMSFRSVNQNQASWFFDCKFHDRKEEKLL